MNAYDWRPITTLPMPDQFPVMVFSKFECIWRVNNLDSLQNSTEITHWTPFVPPTSKADAAFNAWWCDNWKNFLPQNVISDEARKLWHAALAWRENRK